MEENELYQLVPGLKPPSTFSNNLGYKPCTEVGSVLYFLSDKVVEGGRVWRIMWWRGEGLVD